MNRSLPFPSPGDLPKPGLSQCRQILYQLSHKGSPRILEWVAYLSPSPADLPNPIFECRGLLHCRQILYQLSLDLELCPGISQGSNTNLLLPLFLSTYTILSLFHLQLSVSGTIQILPIIPLLQFWPHYQSFNLCTIGNRKHTVCSKVQDIRLHQK